MMSMYSLIEYNNKYSKTWESLCQYYRDDPNDSMVESESSKFKLKITGKVSADGDTKDIKITVSLKY